MQFTSYNSLLFVFLMRLISLCLLQEWSSIKLSATLPIYLFVLVFVTSILFDISSSSKIDVSGLAVRSLISKSSVSVVSAF